MEGGPPSFPQTHRGSWYSGSQSDHTGGLATGLSPSLARRSSLLAYIRRDRAAGPTTPSHPKMAWFGLLPVRSPLLGESRLIFSRQATEMFQFAHLPPSCLCVQQAVSRHHSGGVAPFGVSGLIACMQLPRNVSPVSASFFGLQRRGIHLVLCVACSYLLCYSASLLLYGKIEVRKDSVVYVQVVGTPTTGEWKTAFAVV